MRLIAIAILAAAASCAAHAGDVYKWVDKAGNVHYGDKPKEGGQQVDVKPSSGSGEPSLDAQADANRQANCNNATKQLESYRKASIIKETNSLGQEHQYTPEERRALIDRTEKQVAEACAPPKKQ